MLEHWLLALACAVCFPITGKQAGMPTPELRKAAGGEQATIRWRIRAARAVQEHMILFESHGLADYITSHTLETERLGSCSSERHTGETEGYNRPRQVICVQVRGYCAILRPMLT